MHKDFYASGFLYHSPSRQLLLQQPTSITNPISSWSLIGGIGFEGEDPKETFQNSVFLLLDIKITIVHPIYFYQRTDTDRTRYIHYSQVRKRQDFSSKNGVSFAWFSMRQIIKMHLPAQTEQDITVGIRVIDAATRKRLGEHTFQ